VIFGHDSVHVAHMVDEQIIEIMEKLAVAYADVGKDGSSSMKPDQKGSLGTGHPDPPTSIAFTYQDQGIFGTKSTFALSDFLSTRQA